MYSRKVEGKPPCAPTDDRCSSCGVYVCGECTTGTHPAHGPTQGAHCCKVRQWVRQWDSLTESRALRAGNMDDLKYLRSSGARKPCVHAARGSGVGCSSCTSLAPYVRSSPTTPPRVACTQDAPCLAMFVDTVITSTAGTSQPAVLTALGTALLKRRPGPCQQRMEGIPVVCGGVMFLS